MDLHRRVVVKAIFTLYRVVKPDRASIYTTNAAFELRCKGHFPLGGIFRAARHFLSFKDQLAVSRHQKTKENIIPRGKFRLVENSPNAPLAW